MEDFDAYVTAAWPRLLRSAWLLTGDWHRAEDLVQTVLARAYRRWDRIHGGRDGTPDAYLRAMLATTYLTWWRRRWRAEVPTALPEMSGSAGLPRVDPQSEVELRSALGTALAGLPSRQRAVLMLRFHADLSVEATAAALGLSAGTVKSYTARGLAALRANPALRSLMEEERTE